MGYLPMEMDALGLRGLRRKGLTNVVVNVSPEEMVSVRCCGRMSLSGAITGDSGRSLDCDFLPCLALTESRASSSRSTGDATGAMVGFGAEADLGLVETLRENVLRIFIDGSRTLRAVRGELVEAESMDGVRSRSNLISVPGSLSILGRSGT